MNTHHRKLRDCLGYFTTGVAIATTTAQDQTLYGLTVNSFSSVSLDPPLILFSIDRNSSSLAAFSASEYFTINILHQQQIELSRKFALQHPGKWTNVPYHPGDISGCPILDDGLAMFECRKEHIYDGGDHCIFIGRVINFSILNEEAQPLVYYRGMYRTIEQEES